jgi:hypothetical protein
MKKLNVMIYTETLEALCELPNEDVGALIKHINDWNNGKEVVIENPYHKGMWKIILPDLERNKEGYLSMVEKNKLNGSLGGAPKGNKNASKNKTTEGLNETTQNNPKQHNSNYNYNTNNNSSKEELLSGIEQPKSSEDDSVVSKGLERLESIFPDRKNKIDIDTINLWNGLSQEQKQILIQRATMYVREEKKNLDGQYIKQLSKWLQEQKDKGIEPKKGKMTNAAKSTDPRLLTMIDGGIYSYILSMCNDSTSTADRIYSEHNKKELYSTKEEMFKGIFDSFQNKN